MPSDIISMSLAEEGVGFYRKCLPMSRLCGWKMMGRRERLDTPHKNRPIAFATNRFHSIIN